MPDDIRTQAGGDLDGRSQSDPLGMIGRTVGDKYMIRSFIREGGFGYVYEAYNVHLEGQRLIVKFIKREHAGRGLQREAETSCKLEHHNICHVVDYLPDDLALVMHFIDGQTFGEMLRANKQVPEQTVLDVARGLTSALTYAHSLQIAHRDVTPGNLMIDKNNHVWVIDFGIAKEVGTPMTLTGQQALTQDYAAPERQSGRSDYDPFLSDIYEVGVTLFKLATGQMPYRNAAFPSTDDWGGRAAKTLTAQFRRILRKATDPAPAMRYSTMREMDEEIRTLTRIYAEGGRWKYPIAGAATLAVGVALWVLLWPSGPDPPRLADPQDAVAIPDGEPVTLIWRSVEETGARYDLQVDTDPDFADPQRRERLVDTAYLLGWHLPAGVHFWRVRTTNTEGKTSDYSDAFTVTIEKMQVAVEAPQLLSPRDGSSEYTNRQPVFTWSRTLDSGGYYQLEYASDPDFTLAIEMSQRDTTVTLAEPLEPGDYYWHVRAVDGQGIASPYSTPGTFTVPATTQGRIRVFSNCPVDVYINDEIKERKVTDHSMGLAPGQYTLKVVNTLDPNEQRVSTIAVEPGRTHTREYQFDCSVEILIVSEPAGAEILVDDEVRPLVATTHTITVDAGRRKIGVRLAMARTSERSLDTTLNVSKHGPREIHFHLTNGTIEVLQDPSD